ncbi:MAG: patatin-like phospholipase family protein [Stellaceae bacterium]
MSRQPKKSIKLALQGGGSHGAFTWGVIDQLLEDERLHIAAVSGTSAGAMNAVALADGMARGGPAEARKCLEKFWSATSAAARYSPIQRSLFDIFMGNWSLDTSPTYILMDHLSRILSPYDLNPMNLNPLRDVLARCVDFGSVNDPDGVKLFLTATNVRTGKPKIFRQPGIQLDSVMASACLPFVFKAVEIDGEAYWDGGYMGNPALFPLVDECAAGDIVVIQINPFYRPDVPQSAREIQNRLNEITFNTSLLKELRSLAFLWEIIHYENLERERFRDVHIHAIYDEKTMLALGVSSKLNAEWAFLTHLRDRGRETTQEWLSRHYEDLGVRNTLDLSWIFDESLKPAHLPEGVARGSAIKEAAQLREAAKS